MKQNILIVGGGGREHAIADCLKRSPDCGKLWCAPGNGGTAAICENLPIKATDVEGIVKAAKELKPDIVFVAPDDPLMLGMSTGSRKRDSEPSVRERTPPSSRGARSSRRN